MRLLGSLLVSAFLLLVVSPVPAQVESGQSFSATVVQVTDGDTYDVRSSTGRVITVRFWGVDAPESGQPHGAAATKGARSYLRGTSVRVVVTDVDRYGRVVPRIRVQGGDLSRMLVREGLAWHYDQYAANASELARLEQQARNANRGLWSRANPAPRGNGVIGRAGVVRSQTETVRTLARSPKHSNSSSVISRGTLTGLTVTATVLRASHYPADPRVGRVALWRVPS